MFISDKSEEQIALEVIFVSERVFRAFRKLGHLGGLSDEVVMRLWYEDDTVFNNIADILGLSSEAREYACRNL